MTDEFSVDLTELEQIVTRLSALASFVSDHLDQLDTRIAALTNSGDWSGAAASAYALTHAEWVKQARRIVEGVDDIRQAADTAHSAYSTAHEVNARMTRG